jgi:hypothetical protein
MKSKTRKLFFLGMFIGLLLISCKENPADDTPQSAAAEKYLELKTRMNAMQAGFGQMGNFLSVIGASQLHNNLFQLKSASGDSVVRDSIPPDSSDYWDWWTCAVVTEYDNGDGTYTTIYDYGDGCDEYGSMMKGKITYIWKNEGDDYYSKVLYDHYYAYGLEMNGFSEYYFTSDGNSYVEVDSSGVPDDSGSAPDIVFYWSGTSSGEDNITMQYDNGETYSYTAHYANRWDNSSFTVLEGDFAYISEPAGYEYHYEVTNPLVYDYTCINTWVPVSGTETIHYADPDENYDFIIDYGNGSCDNLAMVIENGETSVVDFGELIFTYCGTEAGESVTEKDNR